MVLEHLFPEDWLEQKTKYAFLLGAGYSVIGISIAKLLFPTDPALVAVAFTSLIMLPELYKLFSIEQRQLREEPSFSLTRLVHDEQDFVRIYLFLFLGILVVYSVATVVLPSFQINDLFKQQLDMRHRTGNAVFQQGLFQSILVNNFFVLIACFLLSLISGDGAIFLITWNASVWGTIFGVTARNAALNAGVSAVYYLSLVLLIVFPHMLLEALSYILAAISGGLISKNVLLERFDSSRFQMVFRYNSAIFIAALVLLLIGAIVETLVLGNVSTYAKIIAQSYGGI